MVVNKDLKILEAILFASSEPLSEDDLKEKINNKDNISALLNELQKFYSNRGVNLIKTADKWSFRSSHEFFNAFVNSSCVLT